jgi:hypothetical protein
MALPWLCNCLGTRTHLDGQEPKEISSRMNAKQRERERKRRTAAKERGRKHIEAARARARKLLEAARARARAWLVAATRPRPKERKAPTKRRTKVTPKPTTKVRKMRQPTESETILLSALRQVAGRSQGLQSIGDVQKVARLPKAIFDATAMRLVRQGRLVLHEHDFPQSLTEGQRAALVEDHGRYFVGMALSTEQTELPELKLIAKARLYGIGKPVRIASLRKDVGLSPTDFDVALGTLQRIGKVALYRDDNRATAKDEGAYFVAGNPRHILYVKE